MSDSELTYMFNKTQEQLLSDADFTILTRAMLTPGSLPAPPPVHDFFSGGEKTGNSAPDSIPAGYTYVLQLISHDIVPKTSGDDPRKVTPALNLDSIYGSGENGFDISLFTDSGVFIHNNALDFDVNRQALVDGSTIQQALIPEHRNDENVLIVQMHRLWQKLHDTFAKKRPVDESQVEKIRSARRQTLAVFHTIVIKDVLPKILNKKVYQYFFEADEYRPFYYSFAEKLTQLPAEFTHAAYRFGHSMILDKYRLNDLQNGNGGQVDLIDLLRKPNGSAKLIPKEVVDWSLFFGDVFQVASRIDVEIAGDMRNIPQQMQVHIVEANLKAGKEAELGSGQAIIEQIKNDDRFQHFATEFANQLEQWRLQHSQATANVHMVNPILERTEDEGTTPLWLSVLHERLSAIRLGILGSAIVGDTLRKSILQTYEPENPASFAAFGDLLAQNYQDAVNTVGKELDRMEHVIDLLN